MKLEFTGERVVPGEVDLNLWNEHRARYAFATRLCRGRRVLEVACGTGYGSEDLAASASHLVALDLAHEPLVYARSRSKRTNLDFVNASADSLPFPDGSFDLVVAFEVIEHLKDWDKLLAESKRVLAPGGQCIVSTPNKLYYAESRKLTGPNPYHEHEFEHEEFCAALSGHFRHTAMFFQNHIEGLLFQSATPRGSADIRLENGVARPEEAHFFVAVCAMTPQTGAPTFAYIPEAANILREREKHIEKLEGELATKDEWLRQREREHSELVGRFRQQTAELEERNAWAARLNDELAQAGERIVALQGEVETLRAGYEAKIAQLEKENHEKSLWGMELDRRIAALEADIARVQSSRWVRLGWTVGLGPQLGKAQ
jgi:2-polyprenyl-3-methyl-5-hydroxy-6-metoxy-1,4-benzoquinol methylase